MMQDSSSSPAPSSGGSLSLIDTWMKALTPSVEGYEALINDPKADPKQAYLWVFIAAAIAAAVSAVAQALFSGLGMMMASSSSSGASAQTMMGTVIGQLVAGLFCGAPIGAALSVLFMALGAALSQALANALGGKGSYNKLVYVVGAYTAPLTLITGIVGSLPFVGCLAFPLGIYMLVLNVVAVKAVNQLDWGRAAAASLAVVVGAFILSFCLTLVVLALLGPAIGNVFSNITNNL